MQPSPHLRIRLLQIVFLLLLVSALLAGGLYVREKHLSLQRHMADLERRHARLAGLIQRQPDILAAHSQANQQLALAAYPASQDATQAANDAQQRIRSLFADNHLDVISLQVLPAKEQGGFDSISINLRVEGDLAGLQAALVQLPNMSPRVITNVLSIQTIGAVRPASIQKLGAQISFSVLRARA